MPWSIRFLVSQFSPFRIFLFSVPALFGFCVSRVFRGPALVDPDLRFSSFYFPKFHLFRPCLVRFAPLVAALRLKA